MEAASFDPERYPLLSQRQFKWHLKSPLADLLVERAQGDVLGYVLGLRRRNSAVVRLYSIAVSPRARGMGVGGRLVRAIEAIVLQKGFRAMSLETRADRPELQAFYEKLGYRVTEDLADYYPDDASAIRMRHDFGAP